MMGKVLVGESIKDSIMLVKKDDSMLAKEDEVLSLVDTQPESRINMVVKEEWETMENKTPLEVSYNDSLIALKDNLQSLR